MWTRASSNKNSWRSRGRAAQRLPRHGSGWPAQSASCCDPADQGAPWGPRYVGDGWRMPAVEDFLAQADAFEVLAAQLEHPGLRARLADIAWTNERHRGKSGRLAVDAYVECVDRLLGGRATPRFGEIAGASFEALGWAQRGASTRSSAGGPEEDGPRRSRCLPATIPTSIDRSGPDRVRRGR